MEEGLRRRERQRRDKEGWIGMEKGEGRGGKRMGRYRKRISYIRKGYERMLGTGRGGDRWGRGD